MRSASPRQPEETAVPRERLVGIPACFSAFLQGSSVLLATLGLNSEMHIREEQSERDPGRAVEGGRQQQARQGTESGCGAGVAGRPLASREHGLWGCKASLPRPGTRPHWGLCLPSAHPHVLEAGNCVARQGLSYPQGCRVTVVREPLGSCPGGDTA